MAGVRETGGTPDAALAQAIVSFVTTELKQRWLLPSFSFMKAVFNHPEKWICEYMCSCCGFLEHVIRQEWRTRRKTKETVKNQKQLGESPRAREKTIALICKVNCLKKTQ